MTGPLEFTVSLFIELVGFDSKSRGACHKTDCGHSRTPQSVAFMSLNLSAEAQRNGEAGIIQLIHYYRADSEEMQHRALRISSVICLVHHIVLRSLIKH